MLKAIFVSLAKKYKDSMWERMFDLVLGLKKEHRLNDSYNIDLCGDPLWYYCRCRSDGELAAISGVYHTYFMYCLYYTA